MNNLKPIIEHQYYPDPIDKETITYYIEYSRWTGEPWRWKLCQRSFIHSKEDWNEIKKNMKDDFASSLMSNEGHPYTIGEGIVNEIDYAADINTRRFLNFMVDSLNDKVHRISYNKGLITAISLIEENNGISESDKETLICGLESSKIQHE